MQLISLLLLTTLCSCAIQNKRPSPTPATNSYFTASDGKRLPIRHWNLRAEPETVVIALHGVQGAARDFKNLGKALPKQSPRTTLYALNLRGSGYDPTPQNRGDIQTASLWQRDLREFNNSLRRRHPRAKFIWLGESMGSLVVINTLAESQHPPDKVVLSSPVISADSIPAWQQSLLRTAAFLAPKARVSLEDLAGGSFQVTSNSEHFKQSETNPYHVEKYSLRYIKNLGTLTKAMATEAAKTKQPVQILYGGKDFLTNQYEVEKFSQLFPSPPRVQQFKDSHHLLFYDTQKKEVISALLAWISKP